MEEKRGVVKAKGRWKIGVPAEAEVTIKVKKGQLVEEEEVVMEYRPTELVLVEAVGLNEELIGKQVEKGAVIYEKKGGWLGGGVKLAAPVGGVVEGIDEFGKVKIRCEATEIKKSRSPVKAKVVEAGGKEVVLEFDAWELAGETVIGGRVWSRWDGEIINSWRQLGAGLKGKLVVVDRWDEIVVAKAEALGADGMVMAGESSSVVPGVMPILRVEKEELVKLAEKVAGRGMVRVLLNSDAGRMLVVVQ